MPVTSQTRRSRGARRRGFHQEAGVSSLRIIGERSRPASVSPARVLVMALGIVLLGLILWFAFSPRFYVTGATIVGAEHIPEETIFAASGLARLHILWANGRAAEQRIREALPSVEKVRVSCFLPARCIIAVTERALAVAWESNGAYYWVDTAGGVFPASGPLEGRWVVRGPIPTDEQGLVAREVLAGLEELERLGLRPGEILYRPGRGLVLNDPAGWRVVIGQGTGMERRLRVYLKVRAYLMERGIHPRFVDVRFPDAPYYSVTNEW